MGDLKKLHIVHLPRAYPYPGNPVNSIFFQEQAETLARNNKFLIGVISVVQTSVRKLSNLKWLFRKNEFYSDKTSPMVYQRIIVALPFFHRLSLMRRHRIAKRIFKKYISANGLPDLIHLQTYEPGSVAIWAKKKFGIPFIVTEHMTWFLGTYPVWKINYARRVYSNSSKRVAVSPFFAEFLSDKFKLEFNYIPNIVDTEFFTLPEKRTISDDRFIFLNICHAVKRKNQHMLILAFSDLQKIYKNIFLYIGGIGNRITKLKALVRKLKLEEKVIFLGSLTKREVRDYMQKSNAFVLSSEHETFGVVLIEAISCGLPVVSTRSGGPEVIITSEDLGELCDHDSGSLYRAMEKVLCGSYDHEKIRENCIVRFSAESFLKRISAVYEMVIAGEVL